MKKSLPQSKLYQFCPQNSAWFWNNVTKYNARIVKRAFTWVPTSWDSYYTELLLLFLLCDTIQFFSWVESAIDIFLSFGSPIKPYPISIQLEFLNTLQIKSIILHEIWARQSGSVEDNYQWNVEKLERVKSVLQYQDQNGDVVWRQVSDGIPVHMFCSMAIIVR